MKKNHHKRHEKGHHKKGLWGAETPTKHSKKQQKMHGHLLEIHKYLENNRYLDKDARDNSQLLAAIVDLHMANLEDDQALLDFIGKNERKLYDVGYQNLLLIEEFLEYYKKKEKQKKIPIQVAEIVAKMIELMDFSKLSSIATVHDVTILLDELYIKLEYLERYNVSDIMTQVKQVKEEITKKSLIEKVGLRNNQKLTEKECKKLEKSVSNWLETFKAKIR